VSSSLYYLLCLAAGLLAIAAASALLVWQQRCKSLRQLQAFELIDSLARHTEWFGAQRHAVCFQAPARECAPDIDEIWLALRDWPPHFGVAARALLDLRARLDELLRLQALQRLHDPEAPLEAGQDAAFMALWREHCAIVQDLERRLAAVARAAPALPHATFTF
jgi:hypothetical protein